MKKFYLLLIMAAGSSLSYSQKLITYGNNFVTTEEFLRAYNKNKTPVTDKEKSIREYLDLYTNFKLKVKAAQEIRLDTLPQVIADIDNFRQQVQENYMSDERGKEELFNEAFLRSQTDLHILHFSIPVNESASPSDTLKYFRAINAAYSTLKKDLNLNAVINSSDVPVRYNDIGYITVFSLPYQFENIVYSLNVGEVSRPYRTKSAWHLFVLTDKRASAGRWRVAQILFSLPPGAQESEKLAISKRADSVYTLLQNGAEFPAMVKKFSEDKLTYMTGGELPEFTTGKYDQAFEKQLLSLKQDGDISRPFMTTHGYHILKRIAHKPTSTDKNDAATQFDIRQQILKDPRIEKSKISFSKEVKAKTGFKLLNNVKEADLIRYADSASRNGHPEKYPISKKEIIRFSKGAITGTDWLKFVIEYKNSFNEYKGENNAELWEKFQSYAADKYYKDHMELYNDDFKYQITEFKEGNMLFEIMERKVWGLANSDTNALKAFFESNKSKYRWLASADVLIFNATNEKSASVISEQLNQGKEWKEILGLNAGSLQVDSGRYELEQLKDNLVNYKVVPGTYSQVVRNQDGTATFVKIIKTYPEGSLRGFDEARGLVINDYQNQLEEQWIESLKKKYPVTIHQAELAKILK